MLPSHSDLEYFLEVSRTLNISRASERIGISQPSLTQSIRKLEENLGVALFIRTRTGVQLTKAGHRLAGQVQNLIDIWGNLQKEAKEDAQELQGRFRLGVHPSVARYTLPQFFRELSTRAPRIEIELITDLSRHITEGIVDFRIDFGFVINPVAHPDLVLRKLREDEVTIFTAKNRYGSLLFGDPNLAQTQWILKRLEANTLSFNQFVPVANLEVVHRLVATGAGFGILPSLVAACEPGVKLAPAGKGFPVFKDHLYLAYRKEVMTSRAAKMLIDIGRTVCSADGIGIDSIGASL